MIYETRGRAREYFELAANLYQGCEHNCVYCYGADVVGKTRSEFFVRGVSRRSVFRDLERDAYKYGCRHESRHILLSFVTDPYQPVERNLRVTRRAIEILHNANLGVAILTKGGELATRDFDLLTTNDLFGTTLTFFDERQSRIWEPGAAPPNERILALKDAYKQGIGTWVSLEPVIDPAETLALISATADFVDHFKVGTMNYSKKLPEALRPTIERIEWKTFAQNVVILLDRLKQDYYIKKDLARFLGKPDGITVGRVPK